MDATDALRGYERLRRFHASADAALSRLDVSDVLDELLGEVRALLGADTATVLLLDPRTRQLVATAAKGLEDEVRRGFRIDVGQGFAGRIAERREPMILTDVTPADVVNPLLLQAGIRSLLGVPIAAADEVVGVLHVGSLTRREFTAEEVLLLQLAADRLGVAEQVRRHRLEHSAALALQHSLIPSRLPEADGLAMAARYLPGHEFGVGGDWYDVFLLPDGWLGVVIGDVSGHGLASAVVMGRLRSALRAYTLISDDPAEVLALLDRKVRHFEAGNLTTALYAMISPERGTVRLSSAGHLRPVYAEPGRPAVLADLPVDAPLGVGRGLRSRHTTALDLPVGALLLGYTDGLVERRHQIIDVGIKALLDVVHPGPPDQTCTAVLSALAGDPPKDDVALLAVRREPPPA
ncbi:PP2C family protein-serine/threonine phosphatase [Actinoplanes octamycinicus]|uniref:PP2C family protein-serine/threonine phosphatase n=1 Tax=Actinoplanes octamycinicus TaxID=135948 RepID=UPI0035E4A567